MQVFHSAAIIAPFPRRPVSVKTLRMWCAPEVILAVTTLNDEATLLPHIIDQARQSGASIILAHVHTLQGARNCRRPSSPRPNPGIREARETIDRMSRQLRWLGFTCQPVLLSGAPDLEIPLLVRSCGVDRVLFGFEEDPDLTTKQVPSLYQQLMRGVDVPVCAIGRNAIRSNKTAIRNVTLAVSSESSCEIPVGFASRLAQELRARLTILHVSDPTTGGEGACTPQTVIDRMPFTTWREAELFCPTQISVREGDPVEGILSHCTSTQQDLLILCSPGNATSAERWRTGVSYRTIAGARCPVFIARGNSCTGVSLAKAANPEKFSPRREGRPQEEERRQLLSKGGD
jgi:nucleotide-binding universal stress UspA family protein